MPYPAGNAGRLIASGLALWLADQGLLERDPGEHYSSSNVWPTYVGVEMEAKPDQRIQVAVYSIRQVRADVLARVQIRVRGAQDGDPATVADKLQQLVDVLTPNGFPRINTTMGDVRVGKVVCGDQADLGRDTTRRHSMTVNAEIRARRIPSGTPDNPVGAGFGASGFGSEGFGL